MSVLTSVCRIGKQFLGGVRERRMTYIVQERSQPNQLAIPLKTCVIVAEFGAENIVRVSDDRVIQQARRVHNAERVLETIVHGAGIDLVCPCELPNSAQPLKSGLSDDFPLPVIERNEAVDRTADFERAMQVQRVKTIP